MSMMINPSRFGATGGTGGDPYISNVVLLMHFEGADGSTTFTDVTGKSPGAIGNAQIDTAQSKFGSASGLFDGTGDRVTIADSADWEFGTGAFTIECFARLNSKTNLQTFITQWGSGAADQAWALYIESNQLKFRAANPSNVLVDLVYGWVPTLGQWYHLAVDRDVNGRTRMYIDGVMVASTMTLNFSFKNSTQSVAIGAIGTSGTFPTYDYNGWIDELRITKGVARYAKNISFEVPTAAFPDVTGTGTVPKAFVSGQWSAIASGNSGACLIRIDDLPLDGGSAITKLQYQIAGGGWQDFVGTGTGVREVTGFTNGVAMNLEIRAVNANGPGASSDIKTPTASNSGQDPYFSSVKLLLHMNGTNGSTTFTDVIGKTMAAAGNAQISTAQSKFGGASGLFDGTGDGVTTADSADWDFGSGAFTIEMFVYHVTKDNSTAYIAHWGIGGNAFQFQITGGNLTFTATIGSAVSITYAWTPTLSQWYHVAAERDAYGVTRLYIDGVCVATAYNQSGTITNSTTSLVVGRNSILGGNDFQGHMDEVRVTKGVARYAAAHGFTVPTAAYPDS